MTGIMDDQLLTRRCKYHIGYIIYRNSLGSCSSIVRLTNCVKNGDKLEKPLVSICCITYNHEEYIKDALEGFLMQETDFPFEVLIHDDASTDRTADIIREYEKKYPEIIKPIYQTENQYSQGLRTAKNNYVRAQGEFIATCEGDDYWIDKHKIQKQVNILRIETNCNVCFHESYQKTNDGRILKARIHKGKARLLSPENIIIHSGITMPTASIMFRGTILDKMINPVFQKPRYSYGDTYLRAVTSYPNGAYYLNEFMSVYRVNSKSSVQRIYKLSNEKKFLKIRDDLIYRTYIDKMTDYNYNQYFKFMGWLSINKFLSDNNPINLKKELFIENKQFYPLFSFNFYNSKMSHYIFIFLDYVTNIFIVPFFKKFYSWFRS